ncbi:MAG TPA: MBL fold metallo-hydrolase [Acidimicrobiia bacterium]|nr:MBL fold metallo-hydrolase [Acidimicrobiia bacterium]
MTDHPLVTRRMIIRDMGKAGLALMVLGTAACSADSTEDSTTPSTGGGPSTSSDADLTTTSAVAGSTSAAAESGYRWERVNLDFVSAYILYRAGEATIVDTGVAGSEGAIEAALGEIGLGWGDVSGLVVTHLHPDHQGSVPAVIAAAGDGLPWFAGAADLAAIEAPNEGQAVGDGDIVGAGLEVIETPGHTLGHISVVDPAAGILVAGDALNGADGGVAGPNADFSEDMGIANASVSKLAGFDYEVALFGHGEPVTAGASGLVADLAESIG